MIFPAAKPARAIALVMLGLSATTPWIGSAQVSPSGRSHGVDATQSASQQLSPQDRSRLQAALAAYTSGRLEEAKPALLDLAKRYPRVPDAQSATGMLLAEQGDIAAAIPYLQRAHLLAPADHSLALNLAVAYLKLSRGAEAEPLLLELCRREPSNAMARYALAQAQLAAKNYAQSASSYERANTLLRSGDGVDPGDLRYNWALALLNNDQAARAVQVLSDAPGVQTSAAMQGLLGEADERNGHYESAFLHLKRATELEPSEANLNAYGTELLQHWSFAPAIEVFLFASSRFPASMKLRIGLGAAYFGNNNFAESAQVFQTMLAADPEDPSLADMLGRSCAAKTGSADADCAGLIAFAKRHPENATASLYAAIYLLHQASDSGRGAEAEALLHSALKSNPGLPDAWYQLATLQQGRNEWQASEESLQRAIALRPAYPEAHYRLSRAYAHTGRRDAAQQQIALQQQYTEEAKQADAKRMKEVITFLTTSN